MAQISLKSIIQSATVAAIYVVLTWLLAPISYGAIQFRISEILILLVVLNRNYAYGLVLGCFVANLTSPLGWYDIVFGTLATLIGILPMLKIKRLEIAAIFPTLSNAFIVALELFIVFKEPYYLSFFTVFIGEFVVLYFLGIPTILTLISNETFCKILNVEKIETHVKFKPGQLLTVLLGSLMIILTIACPIVEQKSALGFISVSKWPLIGLFCGVFVIANGFFVKGLLKTIFNILSLATYIFFVVMMATEVEGATVYPYFYVHVAYILVFALLIWPIWHLEKRYQLGNKRSE